MFVHKNCYFFNLLEEKNLIQSSVYMVRVYIFLSTGVVVAYIRDCSDGINFSINASRFLNFPQDKNITTCSYVQGKFFTCLSMCNTDLCNGPQAAPNTSSSSKTVPFWTMVFLVAMSLYQWQLNFFHYYWKNVIYFFLLLYYFLFIHDLLIFENGN